MGKLLIPIYDAKKFDFDSCQVVRFRSINNNEKEKIFFLNNHSKIVRIPEISKTSKEFINKIQNSNRKDISIYLKIYINYSEEDTLTKPVSTPNVKQPTSLKVLTTDHKSFPSNKTYAISVSAINIDPKNVVNWTTKGKGYSFNLECKDLVSYEDDKVYSLEVNTEGGKNFIPLPFKADLKDKELIKKLKLVKKLFLNTNCILDMYVLKQDGKLIVIDTAFKIELD